MKPTLTPTNDALSAKRQALDAEAVRVTRKVRKHEGKPVGAMKPTLTATNDALSVKRRALDVEAVRATRKVRKHEGKLIRVLREVEDLRAYEPLGFPHLFAYCTKRLHMSEREAGLRIQAVKKVGEFPQLLPALEDGRLTLTTLSTMKHMLRAEDAEQTIEKFAHTTKLEAQEIVAREAPKPPQKSRIRKMPTARANGGARSAQPITPHALDLYKLIVMITGVLLREIQELLAMTKRENPTGDLRVFLVECTKAYRAQIEKNRFGSALTGAKPARKTRPSNDSAYVTRAVKREVWTRDGGQCTFVGETALRCSAREYLEVDHIDPRARGGNGSAENLRLLCPVHHKLVTEATFGRGFIEEKVALRTKTKSGVEAKRTARVEPMQATPDVAKATPRRRRKAGKVKGKGKPATRAATAKTRHVARARGVDPKG